MSSDFMLADDFKPGARVRVGKGFPCMREGTAYTVEVDANGTPIVRCQYEGQEFPGWHYPLEHQTADGRIKEFYLEGGA